MRCSAEGCEVTWRDHDACLLNFASLGWLCRDHHPKLKDGASRPVGYQPTIVDADAQRTLAKAALDKLTHAERSLINSRIVDMGVKSD